MRARSGVPQRADCARHQRIGPLVDRYVIPVLGMSSSFFGPLSPGGAGADNQGMDARRGSVEFAQADELEPPLLVAVAGEGPALGSAPKGVHLRHRHHGSAENRQWSATVTRPSVSHALR